MSDRLPQGWAPAPLGEIARINPRHPKKLDDSMPVSFVPMAAVSESKPQFQFVEERPLGKVRQGFTHFADGDVLFAKITPCMENGKGAVAAGLSNGLGCGTTELVVIRPLAGINPHYIYRFLAQPSVRQEAKENFTGTAGQARVPTEFIEQLEISVAPLSEQHRIVERLEMLFDKVDASQRRLANVHVILKRFRQSVLAAACSGRLTADWREENPNAEPYSAEGEPAEDEEDDLPAKWRTTRIGKLAALVTSGSRGWAKYYSTSGSTFIRAQNINSDVLNLQDIAFVTPPVSAEGSRTKVKQHDLLITITGANVTKSALVETTLEDAYVSQHVALVRLADVRLSKFLFQSIVSVEHGRKQLREAAYGQGKPGLNLDNIRDVVVHLPPLAEQQEIVHRVEALFALAHKVETGYAKAHDDVDRLTASLLARAFRGELVPTEAELAETEGREYEPASALLDRIKHARIDHDGGSVGPRGIQPVVKTLRKRTVRSVGTHAKKRYVTR